MNDLRILINTGINMSSKFRNKLITALKIENEIIKSEIIQSDSPSKMTIQEKVAQLASKDNCYEIIEENILLGKMLTYDFINKK